MIVTSLGADPGTATRSRSSPFRLRLAAVSAPVYCNAVQPSDHSISGLTFSLVGPGRVGSSIAHWMVAAGAILRSVAGRSPASSESLAAQLGGTATPLGELSTGGEELLLLALPDAVYPQVAAALAVRPQAAVCLHTAGSLGAQALRPLATGSHCGAFHPLKSFPRVLPEPEAAHDVLFALEGDGAALRLARRLAGALGGRSAEVPAPARLLYHFAASLASGGVTALLAAAERLTVQLELGEEVRHGLRRLAAGSIAEADRLGDAAGAVTGPAARGDQRLLERYRTELARVAPELLPLADQIWDLTRALTGAPERRPDDE